MSDLKTIHIYFFNQKQDTHEFINPILILINKTMYLHCYYICVTLSMMGKLFFQYILGPFCGTKLPPTIKTKGNRLVIRFHTDLFTEAKGFRAYWTTNPSLPAPTEPPVEPNPWDNIPIGGVSI